MASYKLLLPLLLLLLLPIVISTPSLDSTSITSSNPTDLFVFARSKTLVFGE